MVKKYLMNGMGALALGLIVASCSRDTDFSPAEALEHAESVLGVKIDPNQDWKMTQSITTHITVNKGTGKDYTVYVFDKNPFENEDAVYYTKQTVKDASILDVNLSVPSYLNSLYVSVFDSDDHSFSKNVAIVDEYVTTIFGNSMPDSYLTRSGRRANAGENMPYTSEAINANANEWADKDPSKTYGGWLVPDPLTEEQKNVVTAYFQANSKLTYQDPEWRHFFVQQVYKGKTSPGENSPEEVIAANGSSKYTSDNMNLLTVGQDEQHLNNFNKGDCSWNNTVLDNGGNANDGPFHSDQIMLMVNIDDTSCFGYHNSGCSIQKNDKAALVGWETIRTWANANGLNGDCLKDNWNRSFMGFDFELFNLEESYAKDNGNKIYAPISDVPGNAPQYVWDGEQVLKRGTKTSAPKRGVNRAKSKRAEGTSVNLWTGNEEKNNNTYINFNFSEDGKKLIVAGNYLGVDLSNVAEGASVKFAGSWSTDLHITNISLNAGATNAEIQLTESDCVTLLQQGGLNVWSLTSSPVTFKRVYISEYSQANGGVDGGDDTPSGGDTGGDDTPSGGDQTEDYDIYEGNYIVVNGEEIPYLNANMNMYGGVQKSLADNDMKIQKDGKECLNLPAFKELVDSGYLPVKDKNLREWVKWQGGDKYYSDWIVTLCKAKRINDEGVDEHEEQINPKPAVYSYAFEDSWYADYDMNDVVVKVKANASDSSKIDVTLCCSGAAYNLYVFIRENGKDYPLFGGNEVHAALGGSAGKFINTGDSSNEKFEDGTPNTTTINWPKKFDKQSSDSVYVPLANLDIWIKSPEKDIHVAEPGEDPHGVVIPYDWKWPTEWTSIKTAYPDFVNFAKDQSESLDWYNNPATGSGLIYGE